MRALLSRYSEAHGEKIWKLMRVFDSDDDIVRTRSCFVDRGSLPLMHATPGRDHRGNIILL